MNSEFTIAVHCLVYLAYLPDHMASSEEISRNVCANPARIRKIMSSLRKSGFVKTKKGIGGGYILDCSAHEVTLTNVYRAVSFGTMKPNWITGDPKQDCPISSNTQAVMDQIFCEAEQQFVNYLERKTIGAVLNTIKSGP
ncbi:RrF2 family transcriptional regulator [Peribacillus sp. B-H-3]|uniref:RrF2 family transcriptional regulator n=1 Tax=Peribacillus sp. B-H-3 TaxID=3400420 RepID=UPI003B01398E